MDDYGTKAELERKATDTLQTIIHRWETRSYEACEAQSALDSLWSTAAGLVSPELMDLIAQARNQLNDKKPHPVVAVMYGPKNRVTVVRRERANVRVFKIEPGADGYLNFTQNSIDYAHEIGGCKTAADQMKAAVATLFSKGAKPL